MNLGQWLGLLALLSSLYILWEIRQALLLLFVAIILATALNRLARWLQHKIKIKRSPSVFLAITILILALVGIFWLIVPPFASEFEQLTEKVPKGIERINLWLDQLNTQYLAQLDQRIPDINVTGLLEQLQPIGNQLLGGAGKFLSTTFGAVLGFLLVIVLTLMLLANPHSYRQAFVQLFPSFYRRRIQTILDECEEDLGGWVIGALISMSVIALCSAIGLSIIGVKPTLANAVLAGLLNLIPNIGPTLSVVPPMAIALLDSPFKAFLVFVFYFLIQQFESNLLTPLVMAQQVSLLPAVTLIGQVFFATFFGFLGLLLAIPLTVIGQVFVKEILIKDILDQWQHSYRKIQPISTDPHQSIPPISIGPETPNILPTNPSTPPLSHYPNIYQDPDTGDRNIPDKDPIPDLDF